MKTSRIIALPLVLILFSGSATIAQPSGTVWSKNVALLAKRSFNGFGSSDVWHWRNPQDGKDYALVTIDKGLSIVDVSNLSSVPTSETVHINAENHSKGNPSSPNLDVADVEVYQSGGTAYAYLARASTNINPFVLIINVNNAISQGGTILINPNGGFTSVYVGKINNSFAGGQAHTLTIAGGILYIATQTQYLDVWDLRTNPTNPTHPGSFLVPLTSTGATSQTVHEVFAKSSGSNSSRVYVAFTRGGLKVIEFSSLLPLDTLSVTPRRYDFDRASPTTIESSDNLFDWRVTHSAWPTDDEQYIFTTDELSIDDNATTLYSSFDPDLHAGQSPALKDPFREGAFLRVWKRSELGTSNALQGGYYVPEGVQNGIVTLSGIAGYATSVPNSIHQLFVRGNFAYVAHYTQGFRVLGISNPMAPMEVGYFDDYPQLSTDPNNQYFFRQFKWEKGVLRRLSRSEPNQYHLCWWVRRLLCLQALQRQHQRQHRSQPYA